MDNLEVNIQNQEEQQTTQGQQTNFNEMVIMGENVEGGRLKLSSGDKVVFDVPRIWVEELCGLVKDIIEDCEDVDTAIPLTNVSTHDTLKKIIEYCEYHHDKRSPEIDRPLKESLGDVICDFDKDYIKLVDNKVTLDKFTLVNLTNAANYINCKDLLDLCCASIAHIIKGKSVEEIRDFFGVENDFTPEEEEQIREENKWLEE